MTLREILKNQEQDLLKVIEKYRQMLINDPDDGRVRNKLDTYLEDLVKIQSQLQAFDTALIEKSTIKANKIKNQTIPMLKFQEKSYQDISHLIESGLILLVTATKTETLALLQKLKPINGETAIIEVKHSGTYFIGKFGHYTVAHVECGDMGSSTLMGSNTTVLKAIDSIKPKFVLMLGIAFGVEPDKQNIGDVLVSKSIISYELQRVSKDEIIHRGFQPPASNYLRDCFNNIKDWHYELPNGQLAQLEPCAILSGEKLIDNIDYRKQLQEHFPTAKGGEMEGTGLAAACHEKTTQWILVKAICDFADGEKNKGKEENQALAIDAALSACLHVFNKQYIFENLGINSMSNQFSTKNKMQIEQLINLLDADDIPTLFGEMDKITIKDKYSYNRFRKEYQARLQGIDLIDWKDRMKVFINSFNSN
jgi:nucleoside phosphorylase